MRTEISLKNLYLMGIIAIGLIGLGIGSTFAMFTASANIDNPIYFASNLSSTNSVAETIDFIVPAGEDKYIDLLISNSSSVLLNYSVWYMGNNGLEAGIDNSNNSYSTVGNISSGDNYSLRLGFKNNTGEDISVTVGVSSSVNDTIIPKEAEVIPNMPISMDTSLSDFIYVLGSDNNLISSLSADFYDESNGKISKLSDISLPTNIELKQDEVLLIRYIGNGKSVNIPDSFDIDGNSYKPVLLSYVKTDGDLSTGVFYYNSSIKYVKINDKIKIISLNSTLSNYDNNSMYNMFNGCSSLLSVSSIPSDINNIENSFYGCSNLNSLNLSNIDFNNIISYSDAFNGVNSSINIALGDCTQYNLFVSRFGNGYYFLSPGDFACNYQKVEYIKSMGEQYIDTKLYPKNDKYIFEAKIGTSVNESDTFEYSIFGNTSSGNKLAGTYSIKYKKNEVSSITSNCGGSVNDEVNIDDWNDHDVYVLEVNGINSTYTINGNVSSCEFISPSTINDDSILLFAYGSDDSKYSVIKYYYFKAIDSSGKLVRDMIPCYRKSDGTIGMYDLVNNVFYTDSNDSSTSFVKGENID